MDFAFDAGLDTQHRSGVMSPDGDAHNDVALARAQA